MVSFPGSGFLAVSWISFPLAKGPALVPHHKLGIHIFGGFSCSTLHLTLGAASVGLGEIYLNRAEKIFAIILVQSKIRHLPSAF